MQKELILKISFKLKGYEKIDFIPQSNVLSTCLVSITSRLIPGQFRRIVLLYKLQKNEFIVDGKEKR